MTRFRYYTATTLDGFLADEHDSLAWLFEQQHEPGGLGDFDGFMAGHRRPGDGRDHLRVAAARTSPTGTRARASRCWVFTHRDLPVRRDGVRLVAGTGRRPPRRDRRLSGRPRRLGHRRGRPGRPVRRPRADSTRSLVSIALGGARRRAAAAAAAARPELLEHERNGDLLVARYGVRGPRDRLSARSARGRRRPACRRTWSGSGGGSCLRRSWASEWAPQPWSRETTRPSSLAYSLAQTPNIVASGPVRRTRKPQPTQRPGADWASGQSGPCSPAYHRSAAASRPSTDSTRDRPSPISSTTALCDGVGAVALEPGRHQPVGRPRRRAAGRRARGRRA